MLHKSCLSGRLGDAGFTLIELLVVVLIIGILAAIAVPQYQKAIEKSKGAQALTLLRTMAEAVELYHLSSGEWPTSFADLAISLPPWAGTEKVYTAAPGPVQSTRDWNIMYVPSTPYLRMERLKGPYRGAGFQWSFDSTTPLTNPAHQIICVELASAVTNPGSYCAKIFKAQKTDYSGASRVYILP